MNNSDADSASDYLKKQLIAYIGNKRRLLPFLGDVFSELQNRLPQRSGQPVRFGDCFAGSGSVSRLAKSMGYSVAVNDWEFYSEVINTAHIAVSSGECSGIGGIIDELNSLKVPESGSEYISRHYAPEHTESADFRYERLFYTRENALFLDAVRERIEQIIPGWELDENERRRKFVLLASVLYQAATHANTNGVFKAYHKGFGGHGRDALSRIMAPMKLQVPLMLPRREGCGYEVSRNDAADFVCGRSFDICYLDPPYNQHQYGSNYFMLNTIALWDKPEVDGSRQQDGSLKIKAGIRGDWRDTRSGFCYSVSAAEQLSRLIRQIDARHIVLSYNTEGIIPFEELIDILSSLGKTEIFCKDYVIYRGGRQSIGRSNRNVEYQLVLTPSEKSEASDKAAIKKILKARAVITLLNERFSPKRLEDNFRCEDGLVHFDRGGRHMEFASADLFSFKAVPSVSEINRFDRVSLDQLHNRLLRCRCRDRREEAEIIISLIREHQSGGSKAAYRRYWKRLIATVRKFAFRKYRSEFLKFYADLGSLLTEEKKRLPAFSWEPVEHLYRELGRVAELRIGTEIGGGESGS